jgi:CRP-like cAMP-binding protein
MLTSLSRDDDVSSLHALKPCPDVPWTPQRNFSARTGIPLARSGAPLTFRLRQGCVALFRELSDNRRQILDVFGPGWVVSGECVDLGECRAIAVCPVRIEFIDPFQNRKAITDATRRMLIRAQAHSLLLGRKTATERVASALLDLADQFSRQGHGGRSSFLLYLSRSELADWLGLTHETVSRCLSRFKRDRVIAFNQPELITIRDPQALQALATGAMRAA